MKKYLVTVILGLSVIFATAVSVDGVEPKSWDYIFSRVELVTKTEFDKPELKIVESDDCSTHLFILEGDASKIYCGADKGKLTVFVDCQEPQAENAWEPDVQPKLLLKLPACGTLELRSTGLGSPKIYADSLCLGTVDCYAVHGDLHLPCVTVKVKIDVKPGVTVHAKGASSKEHFDKGLFLFDQTMMGPALWEAFYFRSENKFKKVIDPWNTFSGYGESVI